MNAALEAALVAAGARFGVTLARGPVPELRRAAAELVHRGQVRSFDELKDRLERGGEEDPAVQRMRQAASITETYFWRHPAQLARLEAVAREELLPARRLRGGGPLLVWSAGCATGEEAYSLAMLFGRLAPELGVHVLGTDMNEVALEVARGGVYGPRSFRELRPEDAPGAFVRAGEKWRVSASLRSKVSFARMNLVTGAGMGDGLRGFDVVVCRNVLIYVHPEKLPAAVRRLEEACAARAVVMLTPAEQVAGRYLEGFQARSLGIRVRLGAPAPARALAVVAGARPERRPHPTPVPRAPEESAAAELEAARAAADANRFDEARPRVRRALGRNPDCAEAFELLGVMHLAEGAADAAAEEFRRALYLDRRSVTSRLGLAQALEKMGERDEARRHYRQVIQLLHRYGPDDGVAGLGMSAAAARRMAESFLAEGGAR